MLGTEELAGAEDRPRRRLEPVVVEPDEGAAQEREPVEDLPSGQHHARFAREALVAAQVGFLVGAPERAAETVAPAGAEEHGHVEVDDVPAGEDVGVGAPHVGEEADQQLRSSGKLSPPATLERAWRGTRHDQKTRSPPVPATAME